MLRAMTPDRTDVTHLVAAGYDALGARYRDWAGSVADDPRSRWLDRLTTDLPDGAPVLDLGCGSGVPTARDLGRRFAVTGVDASAVQIDAARTEVPTGAFHLADMTTVDFAPESFDAVVALYSMIHVRLADLPSLVARIHGWLRPGGRFLATWGMTPGEGVEDDWLGVPMYFSGLTSDGNIALLRAGGFAVIDQAVETTPEPEGDVAFHWILARRS
jgi:SAM-dependent methyltransferase